MSYKNYKSQPRCEKWACHYSIRDLEKAPIIALHFDSLKSRDAFVSELGFNGSCVSKTTLRWSGRKASRVAELIGVDLPCRNENCKGIRTINKERRCEYSVDENKRGTPILSIHFYDDEARRSFTDELKDQGTKVSGMTLRWTGSWAVDALKLLGVDHPYKTACTRWRHVTDDELVARASQFKSRTEWSNGTDGDYQYVRACRPHLIEACTAHMEPPGGYRYQHYQVYTYMFPGKEIYIGLTGMVKFRHYDHRTNGPVGERVLRGETPVFTSVAENIWAKEAKKLEIELIAKYKADGWKMLNKTRGGELSLGFSLITWDQAIAEAKRYRTPAEFMKFSRRIYYHAWCYGWLERLAAESGWVRTQLSKFKFWPPGTPIIKEDSAGKWKWSAKRREAYEKRCPLPLPRDEDACLGLPHWREEAAA